ncbi:MAG: hypothetical protein IPM23_06185 [Candidatus Melainabacteria bacterium]|nr:hypothetical protein [Candidatus Melainabacteria bacterium]
MSWPTPQEYNEAIQTPAVSFGDPDLKKGTIGLTALGMPRVITGAFASVYRVTTPEGEWAVRCFLTERPDQKERYEKISEFVLMDDLASTVDFHYVDKGIRVHGAWYPILKMRWVEGQTLDNYLLDNYRNKSKIEDLMESFDRLAFELDDAGIAHGDLQHGNIIVQGGELRLVDYDALYIPSLLGKMSLELGHPNYQHPLRNQYHYDELVDNFSCWLIHYSLMVVAREPDLFERFHGGDDCIIFRRTDLRSPETSELFQVLLEHERADIKGGATLLLRMLWAHPDDIPELNDPPESLEVLPRVKPQVEDSEAMARRQALYFDQRQAEPGINRYAGDADLPDRQQALKTRPKRHGILSRLRGRLKEVEESINRTVFQRYWYYKTIARGNDALNDGRYHEAGEIFLEAYKAIGNSFWFSEVEFDLLMSIGHSLACQNNWSLAQNYFFLAYKSFYNSNDLSARERSVLMLAVMRIMKDERDEAKRLILESAQLLNSFDRIMEKEVRRSYVSRPEVLEALLEIQVDNNLPAAGRIGMQKAILVLHESIRERTSARLDRQAAYLYFRLAAACLYDHEWAECARYFRSGLETLKGLVKKDPGGGFAPFAGETSDLSDLVRSAGVEEESCFPRRSRRFFRCAYALECGRPQGEVLPEINKLQGKVISGLFAYLSQQPWFSGFDVGELMVMARQKDLVKVGRALKKLLVESEDRLAVVTAIEALKSNQCFDDLIDAVEAIFKARGRRFFSEMVIIANKCQFMRTAGYLSRTLFVSGNDNERRQFLYMLMENDALTVLPWMYYELVLGAEVDRITTLTKFFLGCLGIREYLSETTGVLTLYSSPVEGLSVDQYISSIFRVSERVIARAEPVSQEAWIEKINAYIADELF